MGEINKNKLKLRNGLVKKLGNFRRKTVQIIQKLNS